MTDLLYILLAAIIGVGAAVQVSMVASVGRSRGASEAAWINMLGALMFLCLMFVLRSWRGDASSLPSPLNGAIVFVIVATVTALGLTVSLKGLSPVLAAAGFFGFAYLVAAGFVAPRIGIALFASAVTAGTLLGSVALDHFGAFGGEIQRIGVTRVLGVFALVLGVVLVRGVR